MSEHKDRVRWFWHPVDLYTFDKTRNSHPIFTRELLQQAANSRNLAQQTGYKSCILAKDLNGIDRVIWKPTLKSPAEGEVAHVNIQYLTYPEMTPELMGMGWNGVKCQLLRDYNSGSDLSNDEHLAVPIFLQTVHWKEVEDTSPNLIAVLNEWRPYCQDLKRSWQSSKMFDKFQKLFISHANDSVPIEKIVCFGLGDLVIGGKESIRQHLMIFTMAEALDSFYMSQDPRADLVQVILQDPGYSTLEHVIFSELAGRAITFVDDPDGILGIDRNSLVVAPHLPTSMPLMQIIADMFWEDLDKGPVGIISDNLGSIAGRKTFMIADRVTPRVETMLQSYREVWDRETLEEWMDLPATERDQPKRLRDAEWSLAENLVAWDYFRR
ncbi:hypothetical protein BDV96DRAFT_648624 [Lophiotrema nucula]|uniref:SRR1-like domain-containing protein n=1 Tax=Lophiotrema nucula TaxID=690887 RepID=A0A6A5Z0Q6_9PLEO|nr:hypothetical protein BDV96DRAFT_648624 [Lophiotrema nucula]